MKALIWTCSWNQQPNRHHERNQVHNQGICMIYLLKHSISNGFAGILSHELSFLFEIISKYYKQDFLIY